MENFKEKYKDLSEEDFNKMMDLVKEAAEKYVTDKITEKETLAAEIKELEEKSAELFKKQNATDDYKIKTEIMTERSDIKKKVSLNKNKLENIDNFLKAIQNGGSVQNFTDGLGKKISNIPDFRKVNTDLIQFDQERILVDPLPIYIPIIDEKSFEQHGCVFDAIRITTDCYLLCPSRYKFGEENQFVILTLDQLVLTNLYYITKLKATYQAEADRQTQRNIDHYYTLSIERREKHFNQLGYYKSLPAKVKKAVTEETWNSLSLEEKEKLDLPIKRYGPKRIKSKLEENTMWVSFHEMYNQFVNPQALKFTLDKKTGERTEIPLGKSVYGQYGNREVFDYWNQFAEMMQYKFKDIDFQRKEQSDTYELARETSFGESNTKDSLYAELGVLVKRQNGDDINLAETEQIRNSIIKVQSVFGNLKNQFVRTKMKISHTGKKLIFARKAIGVYIYNMGTIGCSDKYGDLIFNTTMAHEIAHMMDHEIGELSGKRWATDDYESTAGKIAFTFRNNMNKPKSEQTDYINATKECFARAFEQYFSVKAYGDDVEIVYSDNPLANPRNVFKQDEYVDKESFYNKISPLIEKFFKENKSFFGESVVFIEPKNTDIQDTISGLEVLLEFSEGQNKQDIVDTIEGLKLLLL